MKPMTKEQFLLVLDDIRARVCQGDSFEGFLNYLMPQPEDGPDAYARVEARYRIGNSDGQGGMRMIGIHMDGGPCDPMFPDERYMARLFQTLEHNRWQIRSLQHRLTGYEFEVRAIHGGRTHLSGQVHGFMQAFDQPVRETPGIPDDSWVRLRAELIIEEAFEFASAVTHACHDLQLDALKNETIQCLISSRVDVDLPAAVDAMADLDYVTEGARLTFGVNGSPVADAVQESNMAKVGGPIDPITKKKLKPPGWQKPDVEACLVKQGWQKSPGDLVTEIHISDLNDDQEVWLPAAMLRAGLTSSTSQAYQLIAQGGVQVDSVTVKNVEHKLERHQTYLVSTGLVSTGSGKRKCARITVD